MAGLFDQADISRVQQASDIIEVVSEHLSLTRKGREMVGVCPFHDDHRPSMCVSPVKQIFKCFACGAGGDVFKFLQLRENLTFGQAVERLADRAGIELKARQGRSKPKSESDVDPNMLARANAWADKYFQKCLNDENKGAKTRQYLAERGINAESIAKWHIGLAPADGNELVTAAKRAGIDEKLLTASGLAAGRGNGLNDRFIDRLMFTISDVSNRVIAFGGRTMSGVGAKYINSPTTALFDKSNNLYGLQQARNAINKTKTVVVVEGYTDVIMAHQFGVENVVASLGTSFTDGHARLLKRYAKSIILVFDSDTAGAEAANRALEVCLGQRIDIKIASVPEGKDPCDFLLSAGKEAFEKVLEGAVDVFESKWSRLLNSFDTDETLAGRKAATEEFLQSAATAMSTGRLSAIEKGLIVNRLATIVGMDSSAVNNELNRRARTTRRSTSNKAEDNKLNNFDFGQGLFAAAQREIIEVLLNEPQQFKILNNRIRPEQFDVPVFRRLAEILFGILADEPQSTLARIVAGIEDPQLGSVVVGLQQTGEEKGNYENRITGALEAFVSHLTDVPGDSNNSTVEDIIPKAQKKNPHSMGMI